MSNSKDSKEFTESIQKIKLKRKLSPNQKPVFPKAEKINPIRKHAKKEEVDSDYIPVKKDIDECKSDFEQGEKIGEGMYSTIHEACKKKVCKWVLKRSYIETDKMKEIFKREVDIVKKLEGTGICPEYAGSWTCGEYGYLAMERWTGSVESFVKESKDGYRIPLWVVDKMKISLMKLSDKRIVHGDVRPANFLYKGKEICITDFGHSIDYSKEVIGKEVMGWHYERFACRTQKEFVSLYNLWQLELFFRWRSRLDKVPVYMVDNNGEDILWTKFHELDEIRGQLDPTCIIKAPPVEDPEQG